jgi:hypothetical protein
MKKFIITIALFLIALFPVVSYAQEEDENTLNTTTQYFDIKLVRDGQSAWNKNVTYEIYVTPKIDSPKTQILWDAPTAVEITPRHKEFVDMYRGQTYSFKAKIKPLRAGSYEVTANLIAWQYDTNYTNSVSDIVTFNQNLIATPIDTSYTISLISKYLIIALGSGLVIWGLVVFGKKGVVALKKWLTPPI